MQRAIDETDRRRAMQVAYNEEHGITPKGVVKKIVDVMEAGDSGTDKRKKGAGGTGKVKSDDTDWSSLTAVQMSRKLKKLDKQMYEHARNLEFEQAAQMRDQLEQLRNSVFVDSEI